MPGAHNEDLRAYVMYPPGFDDSGLVQYPVLMYVYGGKTIRFPMCRAATTQPPLRAAVFVL